MSFATTIGRTRHTFATLAELMAKATPHRSGDVLAGVAAASAEERVDVCHTNHAEADQDDMDTLLTLLGVAGHLRKGVGASFVVTLTDGAAGDHCDKVQK